MKQDPASRNGHEDGAVAPRVEALLRDPGSYRHDVESVDVETTHISEVFLTGPFVYKVKKPVDLGFLDFTTLEKRRRFCEREVRLNQRLSDGVYLGVLPINESGGQLALEGPGDPVEHVVKMRQLPRERTLEHHVEAGSVTSGMIDALADRLADFHDRAERGDHIDALGSVESVSSNARENFEQIQPFVGRAVRPGFYETMRAAVDAFLSGRGPLFQRRIEEGRIRDGHGDLRLDHVYFEDGLQVIDCIEFNERFRYGDVAVDLAFLLTELDYRRAGDVGRDLALRYARSAADPGLFALLHYYKNYRALVRTKVECLRLDGGDDAEARGRAERYLELAHRYARVFSRPTLWVVCGPVASGKSTVADELGRRLAVEVYRSDAIRKEIAGLAPDDSAVAPLGRGIYSEETTEKTYAALLERAGARLSARQPLVLDATYSRRRHREALVDAGRRLGASVVFLECRASRPTLASRLEERQGKSGPSDARREHLDGLLERFEALSEQPSSAHLPLDTERSLEETLLEAFSGVYARQEQQSVETR